jgi:hypothetical protein
MTEHQRIQPAQDAFEAAVARRNQRMAALGIASIYDENIAEEQAAVLAAERAIPGITCPIHGETMVDCASAFASVAEIEAGYAFYRCSNPSCSEEYEFVPETVRDIWDRQLANVPRRVRRRLTGRG